MDGAQDRLDAERAQTVRRLAALTGDFDEVVAASRDTNADDEHDPEGATIAFERSQLAALVRQARQHLAEVETAADRLADGTYGICVALRPSDRGGAARGTTDRDRLHHLRMRSETHETNVGARGENGRR